MRDTVYLSVNKEKQRQVSAIELAHAKAKQGLRGKSLSLSHMGGHHDLGLRVTTSSDVEG